MAHKKKKAAVEAAEIPISSMIDVVFLLLIYFIITQKEEISEAHLAVNLPAPNAAQEKTEEKPRMIEITVLPKRIKLMNTELTLDEIRQKLEPIAQEDPETTVMIKTSTGARTKALVGVLDICHSLGLKKLNLVTLTY